MNPRQKSFVQLHIAIVFFGFTAILGELITLSPLPLVWWRLILAALAFLPVLMIRKKFQWDRFNVVRGPLILVSIFLALHWVTFFGAIKLANASIGVLCVATTSAMTSVIEPLINRNRFHPIELFFGLLIIPGMFLVVSSVDPGMYWGIASGLISAFFSAIFTTFNKSIVGKGSTLFFTFVELFLAMIVLSIIILFARNWDSSIRLWPVPVSDWKYLLVLAVICTTVCYTLAFDALKHMSAFAANLSINVEPIYGILLAAWILDENEDLDFRFYTGAALILLVVFIFPIFEKRMMKKRVEVLRS
ncbi:DMT family transporter [Membranicola marinus]|uniref:DMT family transporter n=1 Tax=Membranihabitans marinus TaxID=1227546 RepID=A0A953HLS4_9BACT|nr:DMT family transporter [Membranihabitans marinus]MBY5958299.1 DMT family transporter [Membranihabitans marinus]